MYRSNTSHTGFGGVLENGDHLADNYQMLEELGSGSFGVVYKAIEKSSGEIVAIKHVDLESSEEDLADILSELSVLSSCASTHVTKYRLAFLRRQTLWIVMEYLGGGSCADLLKPPPHALSEGHIAIICRELLLGLSYLHNEGKLHRDIKAANILLGMDGRVKLADFGVAAQLTGLKSIRNTFVGTPFWMAPEVIQQEGHDSKADVWSLGITAMELANGEPPHANVHPMKVLFLIPKQSAPRLEGPNWSKDFRDFVALCLTKDSDRRPSAKDLLKHRFVRSAGKVEGLQELIVRKQEWDAAKGGEKNLKYYAETLRNLSAPAQDDDWVFETIKAATVNMGAYQTQRKRKSGKIDIINDESATHMMEDLSLDNQDDPLQSQQVNNTNPASTMRKVSRLPSSEYSDFASVRKVAPKRLSSGQQKHPLGVNMSFGNSPSTMRQFKRTSSYGKSSDGDEDENMTGSVVRTPSKLRETTNPSHPSSNMPPPEWKSNSQKDSSSSPNLAQPNESKEVSGGKRLYSRAIGLSCQEVLNETGEESKREAVARLAEAFSDLEVVDPAGLYHIMQSVTSRMKQDPKLQEMLPQIPPKTTPPPSNASTLSQGTNTGVAAGLTPPLTPQSTTGAKLVMAQNNPHLKSHRRRQSAQVSTSRLNSPQVSTNRKEADQEHDVERDMVKSLVGGLEHTRQLADVLFDRWCEGLKVKWPAV